ncbi:MAG: hypothetical protein ACI9N9_002270 [Enterobacterales bacterium]|jgi:hypothetical protein
MTLEDIGNIGDLIAGIVTIVTLGYIALQIKLNTKSVRASTAQALIDGERATAALIAQHSNVYRRGNASYGELNEDEKVVYTQLIYVEIGEVWSAYDQHQNGLLTQTELNGYSNTWRAYMAKPGFRFVWSEIKYEYTVQGFLQWLDKAAVESVGSNQA